MPHTFLNKYYGTSDTFNILQLMCC